MKTVRVTDYTNYAPQKCCGQTDRRTDERTDGWSGPTTRPAFAKATQVKIGHRFPCILYLFHSPQPNNIGPSLQQPRALF